MVEYLSKVGKTTVLQLAALHVQGAHSPIGIDRGFFLVF